MRLFLVFTLWGAAALPCFAQAGRAELFGTVHDPSGLPIAKAKVTLEEQSTAARFEVASDARGEYHLLGLPAGQYQLTIEQPGFQLYQQTGVVLRIGDQTELDVKLQIGQPTESVKVEAEASLLAASNGSVGYH